MGASRSGQSFIELLAAIAVGAIFIVGAAMIIAPSLGENAQAAKTQIAATNAQSLMGNIRVWSEGNWQSVLSLATGSASHYYLITSSTPYAATTGIETIITATTTYTRYFYISDVYRDTSGNLTSSGSVYDPSTKQISVVYNWVGGKANTMAAYFTRNDNAAFDQSDWSGGASPGTVATTVGNQFASSSNINYTTTTGSIYVSGY